MFTVAVLHSYIKRVEQDLDVAQSLLSVVLQQLRHSLGDEALCPALRAACTADDLMEIRKLIGQIDEDLAQGQKPLAARLLHERTGITWDDVHDMLFLWPTLDDERKVRWVRGRLLIQAMRNADRT